MRSIKLYMICVAVLFSAKSFSQSWQMAWQDEFNYTGLADPTKWEYEVWAPGAFNNEKQNYTNKRLENGRVENGKLIIEARRDFFNGHEYSSARLRTQGKGDWLYGRIEVNAKIPGGRGNWPAIWMLPSVPWSYGDWPNSGEIDIMEYVGVEPYKVHASCHTRDHNFRINTQYTVYHINNTVESQFHTYAAEWSPEKIDFFFNNIKYGTYVNKGTGFGQWPFDKPFHLILNVAVGGDWGGMQGIDNNIFPNRMEVEYVRVYKQAVSSVATVYQHCSYGGYAVGLPVGDYTLSQLISRGVRDNDISSLKVAAGYEIVVFQNDNFGGTSQIFSADNSCLVANGINDWITSIRVRIKPTSFSQTIQAENYSAMAGVQTEGTTDTGGGLNVGWIDNGDWMAYNAINIPSAGSYRIDYRVASNLSTGRLSLDLNAGATQLGSLAIPNTGGWQNWTTISQTVNLNAGTFNFGIYAAAGGWNINWFRITRLTGSRLTTPETEFNGNLLSAGKVYPNPVAGKLNLNIANGLKGAHVKILTLEGTSVISKVSDEEGIDVSGLAPGVYSVIVSQDGKVYREKFIKK